MTYEQQIREAKSPQEAMLVIARALDAVLEQEESSADTWGEWDTQDPTTFPLPAKLSRALEKRDTVVAGDAEHTEVVIPAPSEDKMQRRRKFERDNLKLAEYLGGDNDWNDAYVKGGPMWLYLGNRDLVMSLPTAVKQLMIMDVEEDSPKDAHEMGRDLLKAECGDQSNTLPIAVSKDI